MDVLGLVLAFLGRDRDDHYHHDDEFKTASIDCMSRSHRRQRMQTQSAGQHQASRSKQGRAGPRTSGATDRHGGARVPSPVDLGVGAWLMEHKRTGARGRMSHVARRC